MEPNAAFHELKAALEWQVELGADEAIGDAPVNRFEAAARPGPAARPPAAAQPEPDRPADAADAVEVAKRAALAARSLEELAEAIAAFDLCELKRGARNTVFADGRPAAKVMVIGEAPGRDEDIEGRPFVGRAGGFLDVMLAAIDMGRDAAHAESAVYITNILPWRPPQNRDPKPEEIAMMMPFVERHIELANPGILVLMGNIACQAILGRRGITRLRGNWTTAYGRPALPMFHPAYLLRTPQAKREAWADLLELKARLEGG